MLADAKWYMGATETYTSASTGLVSHFYKNERAANVDNGWSANWTGKVGLMYVSDYGYATAGGTTTNRETCLSTEISSWGNSSVSDCKNNDWLNSNSGEWTFTPKEYQFAFKINNGVLSDDIVDLDNNFRPVVYLKSDIQITGGTGTEFDPYTLPEPATKTLIRMVGTDGIVMDEHPATPQLQATTAYRYTGINPNNYVSFNNELWRIIGVFEVDDGTGKLEQRVKLIRKDSLGDIAWDTKNVNDWSKASLMTLFNSGDYWNRSGSYSSTGLTDEAKLMIKDAKWYLGGISTDDRQSAKNFYNYERGTAVYTGRPTSWIGEVGLMYPSDYTHSASQDSNGYRAPCLSTTTSGFGLEECIRNAWYVSYSTSTWTLMTYVNSSTDVYEFLNFQGGLTEDDEYIYANAAHPVSPNVYLKPDVSISGGTGTTSDPYQLSL